MKIMIKDGLNVEELMSKVLDVYSKGGRLVTIDGYVNSDGDNVVAYTFQLGNIIESFKVIGEDEIPTITSVYISAKLFEEEIQELMPLSFLGLGKHRRVFLPEEFEIGDGQILIMSLDELSKLKNN